MDHGQIVIHISTDDSAMKKVDTLASCGECIVNRLAAEADLVIAQGFIEPRLEALLVLLRVTAKTRASAPQLVRV